MTINLDAIPLNSSAHEWCVVQPSPEEILREFQNRLLNQQTVSSSISLRAAHLYAKPASLTASHLAQPGLALLVDGQCPHIIERPQTPANNAPDTEMPAAPAIMQARLDQIKTGLGLSMTQMAELFGVTRKTVYDWYEGAEPRTDKENRIALLLDMLAAAPATVDMKRLKAVWNIGLEGKSFLAILNDGQPTDFQNNRINLQTTLTAKLDELSSRMAKTESLLARKHKSNADFRSAELDQLDRHGDFG